MTPLNSSHQEITRIFGEIGLDRWRKLEGHVEARAAMLVLHVAAENTAICERALAEFLSARQDVHQPVKFQSEREMLQAADTLANLDITGVGAVWVSFMGPRPGDDSWKKACGQSLASLQGSWQKVLERVKAPIILVGEHWFQDVFYEVAPDLLSMRSITLGLYALSEDPYSGKPPPIGQRTFTGIETANHPDYTLEQAKRLAGRKNLATHRAELLLRTAAGYHRIGKLGLAESSMRTALAALQEASATDASIAAERARVLAILAKTLGEMGRRGEALAKAQEAEQICRRLVKMQPGVYEQDLSGALEVLARSLGMMGRLDEALPKAQEAVRIAEQLVKAKPGLFEKAWADSLQALASLLVRLGRKEETLAKAQEIERIFEGLAKAHPETFERARTKALTGVVETLGDMGRLDEAASKCREAVKTIERLAKTRPADFEPELAYSLHLLAKILGQQGDGKPQGLKALSGLFGRTGRIAEALNSAHRSVEIYERLAKTRPEVFEETLADARCTLGERYYELRRIDEAWKNIEPALRAYERLAKIRPETIEPSWARAMSIKRCCLMGTGSPHGAAASTAAVKLLSRHFLQQPQAYASTMAYMVQYYFEDMKAAGQEPDKKLLGPILQILNKVKKN